MRREAAKRKLASQQARRAKQAKRRKQVAVITSAAVVVVVVVAVVLLSTVGSSGDDSTTAAAGGADARPASVSCSYPSEGPAAKPAQAPPSEDVSTQGTVGVTLQTNSGAIPLTLDRSLAPCTVNSFVSLAQQGYFDATSCHRLTTSAGLQVLQCGDPSGTGTGGPGYTIPDEVSPELTYGRGTLAMAKTAAPNSGGSQFFMVYGDSQLPPEYTVFGSISPEGLQVVDGVARAGDDGSNGPGDGAPAQPVTIQTATVG
ncbi:peptidylprolyl isomerase [Pseudonocardia bannensis]|uniref:Peptidylprolyl isomerase n=2 Tax=Pseudonocardia bannensis TaxID=630973 RepID=A0A848DEG0_9PSEU|nr:peptidylprolyl isomerase [Pseudonocardia bannensis]